MKYLLCCFGLVAFMAQSRSLNDSCAKGKKVVIGAVGDIIAHSQINAASSRNAGGFATLVSPVSSLLNAADILYGNLEGPVAPSFSLTSKQMVFNFPSGVARDLKRAGFDVLSLANNHSLDRGSAGVRETLQTLDDSGIAHNGIRSSLSQPLSYSVTQSQGISVAWVSCTTSLNGNSDSYGQVAQCNKNKTELLNLISALSGQYDAVIITPHWGVEKANRPSQSDRALGISFLNAGAKAVLGAHPHVLQPVELLQIGGEERLIAYSLGNFLHNQLYYGAPQNTGAILYLGLTKAKGRTFVNGYAFVPTYVEYGSFQAKLARNSRDKSFLSHAHSVLGADSELNSAKVHRDFSCR